MDAGHGQGGRRPERSKVLYVPSYQQSSESLKVVSTANPDSNSLLACDGGMQTLRDAVAEQVMGWSLGEITWASGAPVPFWHAKDGTPSVAQMAWVPDQDDAQCATVLHKLLSFGYECNLRQESSGYILCLQRKGRKVTQTATQSWRLPLLRAALALVLPESV